MRHCDRSVVTNQNTITLCYCWTLWYVSYWHGIGLLLEEDGGQRSKLAGKENKKREMSEKEDLGEKLGGCKMKEWNGFGIVVLKR